MICFLGPRLYILYIHSVQPALRCCFEADLQCKRGTQITKGIGTLGCMPWKLPKVRCVERKSTLRIHLALFFHSECIHNMNARFYDVEKCWDGAHSPRYLESGLKRKYLGVAPSPQAVSKDRRGLKYIPLVMIRSFTSCRCKSKILRTLTRPCNPTAGSKV